MSWFELNLKWKVLGFLAGNPGQSFYVSQLAKEIESGKGMVSVVLRELEKEGVLSRKSYGNSKFYTLKDNYMTRELKRFYFITKVWDFDLPGYFLRQDDCIEFIVIYGSHSSGTQTADSDLDLLIITSSPRGFKITKLEKVLNKKVNITKQSLGDWLRLKRKKEPFYQSTKVNHRVIYGSELP
ncbi:nucleotidyltransferase domain-containing protein [Candidatus Dependentiae bacterium]|nr:nucleotidyltransferase domain-containing protein [Candidatus Dependentiae bacterium]